MFSKTHMSPKYFIFLLFVSIKRNFRLRQYSKLKHPVEGAKQPQMTRLVLLFVFTMTQWQDLPTRCKSSVQIPVALHFTTSKLKKQRRFWFALGLWVTISWQSRQSTKKSITFQSNCKANIIRKVLVKKKNMSTGCYFCWFQHEIT